MKSLLLPALLSLSTSLFSQSEAAKPGAAADNFPYLEERFKKYIVNSTDTPVLDSLAVMRTQTGDLGEAFAFSSDGKTLFILWLGKNNGKASFASMDVATGKETGRYPLGEYDHDNYTASVSASAAKKTVAVAYRNTIHFFNESSIATPIKTITSENYFQSIAYTPDGKKLAAIAGTHQSFQLKNLSLLLYNASTGALLLKKNCEEVQHNMKLGLSISFLINNEYKLDPKSKEKKPVLQMAATCDYWDTTGAQGVKRPVTGLLVCNLEGTNKGKCFIGCEQNFSKGQYLSYNAYSGLYIATPSGFFAMKDPNAHAGPMVKYITRRFDAEGIPRNEVKLKSRIPTNTGLTAYPYESFQGIDVTADKDLPYSLIAVSGVSRVVLFKNVNGNFIYQKTLSTPFGYNHTVKLSPGGKLVAVRHGSGEVSVYKAE